MDIIQAITQELKVEKWQVEAAVKLIDEGNTIPFISRYRKEATGSLNDEQLRTLSERLTYLRNLEDKKNQVLKSIEDQGKLTEELRKRIEQSWGCHRSGRHNICPISRNVRPAPKRHGKKDWNRLPPYYYCNAKTIWTAVSPLL